MGEGLLTPVTPLQGGGGGPRRGLRRNSSRVRAAQVLRDKTRVTAQRQDLPPLRFRSISRLKTPRTHLEDVKKVISHRMSLSRKIRAGSQEDLKMAGDLQVVRGWGWRKGSCLLAALDGLNLLPC